MPAANQGAADHLDPAGRVNRRLAELEKQVRELRAARRLESATIGDGGLTVSARGSFNVVDDFDNFLLTIGAMSIDFTGGGEQYGFLVYRQNPDGTPAAPAITMYNSGGVAPQTLGLYDAAGNNLWTDDAIAAQGIGRPYLPIAMGPVPTALQAGTSAGSWALLYFGVPVKQQPKIYAEGLVNTPAGVTAQLKLTCAAGQIGPTISVPAASNQLDWTIGPDLLPGNHMDQVPIQLQGQITGGAGTMTVSVGAVYGCQS